MSVALKRTNYPYEDREFIANSFIIGNGRIGYKGTLEEERATDKVTLNIVGVYDQSGDKWRESLNAFNPLFVSVSNVGTGQNYHYVDAFNHTLELDIENGVLYRQSEFKDLLISSERFIHKHENVLAHLYTLTAKEDVELFLTSGIDQEVYEINGPHYKEIDFVHDKKTVAIVGLTNEGHEAKVIAYESINRNVTTNVDGTYTKYHFILKAGQSVTLTRFANIVVDDEKLKPMANLDYDRYKKDHSKLFSERFNKSRICIEGNEDDQFALDYSIYHLLILENAKYLTSIPARGLSGQVYKGAIFWDTEIFMLPFYLLTNPKFAKNLIEYRIHTLEGAKHKAITFGHQGAYYAWESQEDGQERCSLYNVTDAKTNKPLRTYFADKQIHISIDVVYGLKKYLEYTDDFDVLKQGGFAVIGEVFKFYQSYATFTDGHYHFNDVVGPDEYHERVNDNAFTNYHIYLTFDAIIKLIETRFKPDDLAKNLPNLAEIKTFIKNIYLPQPNKEGIIEQFSGYFALEDIGVATLKSRVVDPKAYLGGEHGLATPTRVIKQADVVALFVLHFDHFDLDIIKRNYQFYEPYTEHGSSLSSSAYGLISARIGELEKAHHYFYRSATIDLSKDQKLYAGGIFIGGTHPASSGGAYNNIVYGFLGAHIKDGKLEFSPNLHLNHKKISFSYWFRNKYFTRSFTHD